jgi:stage III sporulation protein AE
MGAVPVVGGIISNAAGVVLTGAAALKSSIGIAGVLAIFAVCLMPFLRLAVHYLLYKLVALFAGTFGSQGLVGLVDALGSAFGLVLGMTGACAILLVISVMSCVMVVTT